MASYLENIIFQYILLNILSIKNYILNSAIFLNLQVHVTIQNVIDIDNI